MSDLFTELTHGVQGAPAVALAAAAAWGVLSVIASPCHLASIPLIVGFVSGQGRVSVGRALGLSSLFALGILITIAAIGVLTSLLGRVLGDVGDWTTWIVAVVLLIIGLHLLDVIPMPWSGPANVQLKFRGAAAALILGLVFGIAVGPCTFAYMAPVLGVVFEIGGEQPIYAALLVLVYGLGHCAVIIIAGSSTRLVQRYLDWTERTGATNWVRRLCGVLVIAGGLYFLYKAA